MGLRTLILLPFLVALTLVAFGQRAEKDLDHEAGSISIDSSGLSLNLDPSFRFELERSLQRKDYEEAERLIVNQIETNPDAPVFELLVYLGGLFFVDEKYLNAAVALKKAEAIEPLDNGNRFTLAMAYVLLGRRDWARPELEILTAAEPGNPLYPYWIARLDYDDIEYAVAIEKLNRLLEKFPRYVRAYDRLALCYEALGRNEEAIAAYERAVDMNRKESGPSPWPPLNLGTLLIQVGRLQEAEHYLREAVAINPGFAQAHYKLGLALEKLENYQESAAALRHSAELDPDYPDPHWALARVLRLSGDREGAADAVRQFRLLKGRAEAEKKTSPTP